VTSLLATMDVAEPEHRSCSRRQVTSTDKN